MALVPQYDEWGNIIGYQEYQDPGLLPNGSYEQPRNPEYGQVPGADEFLGAPPNSSWDASTGHWTTNEAPSQADGPSAGGPQFSMGGFAWPSFSAPRFSAPSPFSYPDFSYKDFTPPSLEDAKNEPGYEFARSEGLRALTNDRAAQGVRRIGGTLKDLITWGDKFAEQNYGNVFNRGLTTYSTNRGNAFGNWSANRNNAAENYQTNYGISRDVFDRNYKAAQDEFQPQQRQAELTFDDLYRRWKAELDSTTELARPVA